MYKVLLLIFIAYFCSITLEILKINAAELSDIDRVTEIQNFEKITSYDFIEFTNKSDIIKVEEGNKFADVIIPTLDIKTEAIYGIKQSNVDKYDICISAYNGVVKPIILCGHSTNSLSNLKYIENGDYIYIKTSYGTFCYIVDYGSKGILTKDGKNILVNNEMFIDTNIEEDTLYIFTCAENEGERYVAKATLVCGTRINNEE